MNASTLIHQTMLLSASHFVVRVMGFALRIWLSRALGAQAMGLVELAQSAQMLLITPVVSGLPAAMSRMCAKACPERQVRVLRCGLLLALCTSLPIAALAFSLRIPLALWLGDIRTLPALLVYLPCIPVLGLSCALNGYFYGKGKPAPPALCELLEQIVRLILTMRLVNLFSIWPMTLRAAIPSAATLAGETISLAFMLLLAARTVFFEPAEGSRRSVLREMLSLALPLTGMRLVTSLMRTAQSALIPARLQAGGMRAGEALAQMGMFSGMLMPVLMLPSFITCSLSMVAAPELARRQAVGKPQRALALKLLRATLALGLCAMVCVWALAPFISSKLYRQVELLPMLRYGCALVPVMALSQVVSGMMNGLGLQATSLKITLLSSLVSVLVMYAAMPAMRIWGMVIAMATAQAITLAWSLRALLKATD